MKEQIKEWGIQIKMFSVYMFTEPFRQLIEIVKLIIDFMLLLNKTSTWTYVAVIGLMIGLFLKDKQLASLFMLFLVGIIFWWEWQRGYYKEWYRKKVKKQLIKKEAIENGKES